MTKVRYIFSLMIQMVLLSFGWFPMNEEKPNANNKSEVDFFIRNSNGFTVIWLISTEQKKSQMQTMRVK